MFFFFIKFILLIYQLIYITDESEDATEVDSNCIICGLRYKKNKRKTHNLKICKTNDEDQKKQIADIFFNKDNFDKYNYCLNAKELNYHKICLLQYYKPNSVSISADQDCIRQKLACDRKRIHNTAFKCIVDFVQNHIITSNEVHSLTDLYEIYTKEFKKENSDKQDVIEYTKEYVCNLLKDKFKGGIDIVLFKQQRYLCSDKETAFRELKSQQENDISYKLKKIAIELRDIILSIEINHLPKHNISEDNISNGECEIPEQLYNFIRVLVYSDQANGNKSGNTVRINSICHNIMYCMFNGRVKPSTHLGLGLVLKSKTNCRQVVDILNKLGYCPSYNVLEEIEAESAYYISSNKSLLPYGLVPKNNKLYTATAFDNYDKCIDTMTGNNTMHDTVGIVFQNSIATADTNESIEIEAANLEFQNESVQRRRRRRYISPLTRKIHPYTRISSGLSTVFEDVIESYVNVPINLNKSVMLDNIWMLNQAYNIEGKFDISDFQKQ